MSDVDFGSGGKGDGGGGFDLGGAISNLFGGGGDNSNAPTGFTPPSTVQPSIDSAAPTTSPFVLDSPIAPGSLDYLGAGTTPAATADIGTNTTPGAGFNTSDASLSTGNAPTLGSTPTSDPFGAGSTPLAGANSAGQPFAAGGTTAIGGGGAGASINPNAVADLSSPGSTLANPGAAQGATSFAPAAPSAAGSTPADATSSWADMLKKGLTSNPLGTAIAAGGLSYNILQGQKQTANQGALTQQAQQAGANSTKQIDAGISQVAANQSNAAQINDQAKGLEQYLTTGQLPPQYTQQIDQAINDAKTTAISNAAKNGQPTDPTKNTALAQQLAQIDSQRAGMTSQIAQTLFSAGSGLTNTAAGIGNASASSLLSGGQNAAGLSGQLYSTLTGIDSKQADQTAKAIAALAQSLNSGGTTSKAA